MNWSRVAYTPPKAGSTASMRCKKKRSTGANRPRSPSTALDACTAFWLPTHPASTVTARYCLECQEPLAVSPHSWLPIIIGPRRVAGIHADCYSHWRHRRRREAVVALALTEPSRSDD